MKGSNPAERDVISPQKIRWHFSSVGKHRPLPLDFGCVFASLLFGNQTNSGSSMSFGGEFEQLIGEFSGLLFGQFRRGLLMLFAGEKAASANECDRKKTEKPNRNDVRINAPKLFLESKKTTKPQNDPSLLQARFCHIFSCNPHKEYFSHRKYPESAADLL